MLNQTFLSAIKSRFPKNTDFNASGLWIFLLECFAEHEDAIESLIKIGYEADACRLVEVLSGPYPIICMHEESKFVESVRSGKSDLIPSVTFTLPNRPIHESESEMRILRIEFGKPGMAPVDLAG